MSFRKETSILKYVDVIDMIKNMHDVVATRVRTLEGRAIPYHHKLTSRINIKSFLFAQVMDEPICKFRVKFCWILFTNDIILVDETREDIIFKVES